MKPRSSEDVRAALRQALESQIRDADPPETKLTLDRLIAGGIPEDAAWQLMSLALLAELNAMSRDSKPYDSAAYVRRLQALPRFTPE